MGAQKPEDLSFAINDVLLWQGKVRSQYDRVKGLMTWPMVQFALHMPVSLLASLDPSRQVKALRPT